MSNSIINITLSTSWYQLRSKFPSQQYIQWMSNMLSNVESYYLVIYTDEESCECFSKYKHNPKIKIIIKPFEEFYTYKYKDGWEKNHERNTLLNDRTEWRLNALWSEKVHFVHETMENKYFDTEFYGWCDIGYFRERYIHMMDEFQKKQLFKNWPDREKIQNLDITKIYYSLVNYDNNFLQQLGNIIQSKNEKGLPTIEIPSDQVSIGGGFFMTHKDNMDWWRDTYDAKLALYFENEYLVKDDQIIIADCVFSNLNKFALCQEANHHFDPWFVFLRFLG